METTDVRGYLEKKGLHLRRAGGDEVHTHCFFCGESERERGRLYINVDPVAPIPGLFHCKLCDKRGALPTIMRHFGDQPERGEIEDDRSLIRRDIIAEAAAFYHEQLSDHEEAYAWLRGPERGLTLETIVERQLGYAPTAGRALLQHLRDKGFKRSDIEATGLVSVDDKGRTIDSLVGMVTIPYTVAGNVVQIRGRKWPYDPEVDEQKYKTPKGGNVRLYNTDALWHLEGTNDIIIAEGEFDALVIHQLGFVNVVALPGANVWQDAWDAYLTDVRRVFTLFDADDAGASGLRKLTERHGAKLRQIDLSEGRGKLDPTTWVAQGGTANVFARFMRHSANSLLVSVDEAFAEWLEVQSQPGLRFGVEMLDGMIHPGLLPGQVLVVLAKSGTGKTLFLLNVFERMRQVPDQENLKILFLSLEQTRGEWWERARRIHRFYNLGGSDTDSLDYWRDNLYIVDKNRLSEAEISVILDDFEDRVGEPPDLLALDYLGYFAQSFTGERYARVSDAIMGLKGIGKDRRIPVITPHQVSRIAKYGEEPDADAARDAGVVEETADFLFLLWTQDHLLNRPDEAKTGTVQLKIGKSRHGGRGTKIAFQFGPSTLTLVPQGDTRADLCRQELKYESFCEPWERTILRHRGLLPVGDHASSGDFDSLPVSKRMELLGMTPQLELARSAS